MRQNNNNDNMNIYMNNNNVSTRQIRHKKWQYNTRAEDITLIRTLHTRMHGKNVWSGMYGMGSAAMIVSVIYQRTLIQRVHCYQRQWDQSKQDCTSTEVCGHNAPEHQ